MGGCQNYGPFLGPYYNTGPNLGDPKRDHNFDNPPYNSYIQPPSTYMYIYIHIYSPVAFVARLPSSLLPTSRGESRPRGSQTSGTQTLKVGKIVAQNHSKLPKRAIILHTFRVKVLLPFLERPSLLAISHVEVLHYIRVIVGYIFGLHRENYNGLPCSCLCS